MAGHSGFTVTCVDGCPQPFLLPTRPPLSHSLLGLTQLGLLYRVLALLPERPGRGGYSLAVASCQEKPYATRLPGRSRYNQDTGTRRSVKIWLPPWCSSVPCKISMNGPARGQPATTGTLPITSCLSLFPVSDSGGQEKSPLEQTTWILYYKSDF